MPNDLKDRIRHRLAELDAAGPEFDDLTELVSLLEAVSGGFSSFSRWQGFTQGPPPDGGGIPG